MNSPRRLLLLALAAACLPLPTLAAGPANLDARGVAIHGHDPVAYFTVGAPTLGNSAFTAKHNGVTYQFANAANRTAFQADPAKYAPQFGGFCAMGVVLGAAATWAVGRAGTWSVARAATCAVVSVGSWLVVSAPSCVVDITRRSVVCRACQLVVLSVAMPAVLM